MNIKKFESEVSGHRVVDVTVSWLCVIGRGTMARLILDDGRVAQISLEEDCCSSSYFADAKQFAPLIGRIVVGVEERDLGEVPDGYGVTSRHCIVITTDQGHETIDWRNDSNGHYDGWVTYSIRASNG